MADDVHCRAILAQILRNSAQFSDARLLFLCRCTKFAAWMLGDTRDDVEAARGANVLPFGVLTPHDQNRDTTQDTLLRMGAARVLDEWTNAEGYLP